MVNLIIFLIFLILLMLGFGFGKFIESSHYDSIKTREEKTKHLPVIMVKKTLNPDLIKESKLVNGGVVISIDYFKKFVAFLVNLFGGSISSYETLLDRARREAILRMKYEAKGASEIINVRIETSPIYRSSQSIGSVEVFAYGTAVYKNKPTQK